jgi:hypothetical protein
LINSEAINNIDINYPTGGLEKFISEIDSEKLNTSLSFTNSATLLDDAGTLPNINGYKINTNFQTVNNVEELSYEMLNYNNMQIPIIDLLKIYSDDDAKIKNINIDFAYYFNNQFKNFTYKDENEHLFSGEYVIKVDKNLRFDISKGDINVSDIGLKGFFIPDNIDVDYKITLVLEVNGNQYTYILNNKTNFLRCNEYYKMVFAKHITIDNILGYE